MLLTQMYWSVGTLATFAAFMTTWTTSSKIPTGPAPSLPSDMIHPSYVNSHCQHCHVEYASIPDRHHRMIQDFDCGHSMHLRPCYLEHIHAAQRRRQHSLCPDCNVPISSGYHKSHEWKPCDWLFLAKTTQGKQFQVERMVAMVQEMIEDGARFRKEGFYLDNAASSSWCQVRKNGVIQCPRQGITVATTHKLLNQLVTTLEHNPTVGIPGWHSSWSFEPCQPGLDAVVRWTGERMEKRIVIEIPVRCVPFKAGICSLV